jgi:hypothetical protein
MRTKTNKADQEADQQLLEALNQHPQLKERIMAIVRLAVGQEGTPCTADEIERLLMAEVRQLGQETMRQWAQAQAAHVAGEVDRQYPQSYRSKKNA